jgi:hypothetical protein
MMRKHVTIRSISGNKAEAIKAIFEVFCKPCIRLIYKDATKQKMNICALSVGDATSRYTQHGRSM